MGGFFGVASKDDCVFDLLLENIEALAAGESGDDSKCFGSGSIVCPLTNQGVAHVQIYYSLPH